MIIGVDEECGDDLGGEDRVGIGGISRDSIFASSISTTLPIGGRLEGRLEGFV